MSAAEFHRQDVRFRSGDASCAAWLYRPEGAAKPPLVILGHGLGATREMRLDAYCAEFAAAGIAALAFTYRHFGDSGGQPRQLLSIRRQLEDWEAAIAHAKSRSDINVERIAIWGSSFGGGHVLTLAARHPELLAAVAQCPFTDGVASARAVGPSAAMRTLPRAVADGLGSLAGREPVRIPVAAKPGAVGLMSASDALPGYMALVPDPASFRNEVAARISLRLPFYRPGRSAGDVRIPILFCVSKSDTVAPAAPTLRYAQDAPLGRIRTYEAGHFDFYLGKAFRRIVADQRDFLVTNLVVAPRPSGSKGES